MLVSFSCKWHRNEVNAIVDEGGGGDDDWGWVWCSPGNCDCGYDSDVRALQECGTGKLHHPGALNHGLHGDADLHNQTAELKRAARCIYRETSLWQILCIDKCFASYYSRRLANKMKAASFRRCGGPKVFSKWMFRELVMFNKLPIPPLPSLSAPFFLKQASHCDQKWIEG